MVVFMQDVRLVYSGYLILEKVGKKELFSDKRYKYVESIYDSVFCSTLKACLKKF